MKALKELNSLKDEALNGRLEDLRKELMKLQSQVASGTIPKNPGRIKSIRKTIARIFTIQTGRKETKE